MTDWSRAAKTLLLVQLSSLQGFDTETNGKRAALIAQIAEIENQEKLIELSKSPEQRAAEAATRAAEAAKSAKFWERKKIHNTRATKLVHIGFKKNLYWIGSLLLIVPFVMLCAGKRPEWFYGGFVVDVLLSPFIYLFFIVSTAMRIDKETKEVDTERLDAFFANQDKNCPDLPP